MGNYLDRIRKRPDAAASEKEHSDKRRSRSSTAAASSSSSALPLSPAPSLQSIPVAAVPGLDEEPYETEDAEPHDDGQDDYQEQDDYGDDSYGDGDDSYDGDQYYKYDGAGLCSKEKYDSIISGLQDSAGPSEIVTALEDLCEVLCLVSSEVATHRLSKHLVPRLVDFAGGGFGPEITVLSVRAITYLCDAFPLCSPALVNHGILSILCGLLISIEYVDVAEQCLQALEKLAAIQPVQCLQAGAVTACLSYFDFFTISTQKVAISAVSNMFKKVQPDCFSLVMGGIPTLCTILNYDDLKLVETTVACLTRAIQSFSGSPEMLDELCGYGLIEQCSYMIASNGQKALGQITVGGLVGILARLAAGSVVAAKAILELHISSMLRDTLLTSDVSDIASSFSFSDNKQSSVAYEVIRLLVQLFPPVTTQDMSIQLVCAKEKILTDQPLLLHECAGDLLAALIQVVDSGANIYVCCGCVTVINSMVYFTTSEVLIDILKGINISSFLSRLLTQKDPHVLLPALKIADILLKKRPDLFLSAFVKEGVVFAVDALLNLNYSAQNNSQSTSTKYSLTKSSKASANGVFGCLCYAFDLSESCSPETKDCRFGMETVVTLAKHIKATNFTSLRDIQTHSAITFQNIKSYCSVLNDNVDSASIGGDLTDNEHYLHYILYQIMSEFHTGQPLSVFEFLESGIVRSFIQYLTNGRYLLHGLDRNAIPYDINVVVRRIQDFAGIILSMHSQHREGTLLTGLVQKLQSALSSLDNFLVVPNIPFRSRNVSVTIPFGNSMVRPCFRVLFIRDKHELIFNDYPDGVSNIEPLASFKDIEEFLWPKIHSMDDISEPSEQGVLEISHNQNVADESYKYDSYVEYLENYQRSASTVSHSQLSSLDMKYGKLPEHDAISETEKLTIDDTLDLSYAGVAYGNDDKTEIACRCKQYTRPKLIFYLDDKELDQSLTLYQAILQQKVHAGIDRKVNLEFWDRTYEIVYRSVFPAVREFRVSSLGNIQKQISSESFQSPLACGETSFAWMKLPFFSNLLMAELPCKIERSNPAYDILFLLKVLEGVNRFAHPLLSREIDNLSTEKSEMMDVDDMRMMIASAVPQTEFSNRRLTEKLEQQMRGPLPSSTNIMPFWWSHLVAVCPFLFSFKARCKFFRLDSVTLSEVRQIPNPGESRENYVSEWHGDPTSLQGGHQSQATPPRTRCKVDRCDILGSADRMMRVHASSNSVLEVQYDDEVGTGLGPTLEFYALVSREFHKVGLGMWRGDHNFSSAHETLMTSKLVNCHIYVDAPLGLFPRPWLTATGPSNDFEFFEVIQKFTLLGQLVAKAIKDGRILDLPFSKAFYKLILEQELDIYDIQSFDPELGLTLLEFQSLINKRKTGSNDLLFRGINIQDLCINFTLPGYSEFLLSCLGDSKMVDITNLEEYVTLVVDATVRTGIAGQVEAFKAGFNEVLPLASLQFFSEDELDQLLCGEQDCWTLDKLLDNIKFDHGYTANSEPIIYLLEIMREFGCDQRRAFLQFATGAPRLPLGGLAALKPQLTVVRKHCSGSADMCLPSVMTCTNYLKLPPYSSKEIAKERLLYAITEGQGSFHLS